MSLKYLQRVGQLFAYKYATGNKLVRLNSIRKNMNASKLIFSEYGDPVKVITDVTEELPSPKDDEIVVKLLAAPVNPADINTIQGVYPVKPKLPAVGGNEGVGEVECVGKSVTNFQVGDRVIPRMSAWGTWRTRAVCKPREMMKVSKEIGVIEAATLTVNPCTAYRMLKDFVCLKPGESIIQNGANSAAGQNVIQLCKAWGICSVNVVRDRPNIDELKQSLVELGATVVLTEEELRNTQIFKDGSVPKPKLALNCVGGKNALSVLRNLDKKGIMVTYGGMSREPVTVPTSALIFNDVHVRGFWMTRWSQENADSPKREEMFSELTQLILDGKLKASKHKIIRFTDYKEALENAIGSQINHKYILNFQDK